MNDVRQAKAMEEAMLADLLWLSPYGALVLAAIGAVVLALALPRHRQGLVGAYVAGAHLSAAGLAAGVWLDRGFRSTMSGTVVVDGLALAIVGLLGVSGAIAVALARPTVAGTDREGEFYAVLAAASFAAAVLSSAGDVALIALSLGLLSLSSFILAGYLRGSLRGNEAALKYYIYGTVAGAAMVYGLSFWFGLAGSTELGAIGRALPEAPVGAVVISTALVVVGLGYKASLVPFHFWTPDVYEGAPLPVTAYLSVLPKIAGLVALARVMPQALPDGALGWPTAIAILAAVTMTLGNLAALWQSNVIRLLAYSSIAQAGYLLMGVAAMDGSEAGLPALVYYLGAYAATNLAAFAVVLAVQRESGSAEVAAFAGLGRRHPWWAAALFLSFLSLLGLPPLSGFVGKLEVFLAAIDAGQAWLAVVAVLNTVVSLFYYLRVIAPTVLSPASGVGEPRPATPALVTALAAATIATVALGLVAEPLLDLADGAQLMGAR
ncbi:MAG: NADH-quinone oxidoreductase subunit N [Actinomycetota bacterium]|nr:NADH-quinone oxidoreductase subunit N [Actinomycetota bacterium]